MFLICDHGQCWGKMLALGALQALHGDLFHVKIMLLCVTSTHLQIRRRKAVMRTSRADVVVLGAR